jgi:hypothetical protein
LAATNNTPQSTVCDALGGGTDCKTTPAHSVDLNTILNTVIRIFSWVIGVIAVIMVMVSGFRYITAGGDSGKVASAKNTLIYAIVGLVIAAVAQILVKFVLHNVTK